MSEPKGKGSWRISTNDRSLSQTASEKLSDRKESAAMLGIIEAAVQRVSSAKFTEVQSGREHMRSADNGRFFPIRKGRFFPLKERG